MKAVMVMFDTLTKKYLTPYNKTNAVRTQEFDRLANKTVCFDNFYSGSLPCMPARRELHTGRYNFLHRSWGPLEPFDVSAIEMLKNSGVYTHIVTDHDHYWEDGGATYVQRFNTWQGFRGQEGDHWMPMVDQSKVVMPEQHSSTKNYAGGLYQNWANRTQYREEKDYPSVQTVEAGLNFIQQNHQEDNWFLQIECFDPHEPFDVPQKYLDMVGGEYKGKYFDCPQYHFTNESEQEKEQIIKRYQALILMCDTYLGKILDHFDTYNLWQDTMLIVNTDHGFLLGEHNWWGKNLAPFYQEVVHLPFFLYDPRNKKQGQRCAQLAQTIDIAPTLMDFFGLEIPKEVLGSKLDEIIEQRVAKPAILFGMFGTHVSISDGEYVYMRSVHNKDVQLFEHTVMPTRMRSLFSKEELKHAELCSDYEFMGVPVLKTPVPPLPKQFEHLLTSELLGTKLFHIAEDPDQKKELDDIDVELRMIHKMIPLMKENDCPPEVYQRLGITENMTKEDLLRQREEKAKQRELAQKAGAQG